MKTQLSQVIRLFVIGIMITGFMNEVMAQSCTTTERIGNALKPRILSEVRNSSEGATYKISSRKTMVINKIEDLRFEGCKVFVTAQVTLKRKIRRNAKGRVYISATVNSFNPNKVCLKNPKLDKVRLSNTLRVGEAFYKWAANRVLPNNACYNSNSTR
ncbi:hypothetical protein [Robiginitalea sp. IMCC43444]|uniref:hypothetical protein n=1 Tax=Robiginitalea sp. IMCC43444 TaxID=3459121 RepID=UPI004042B75A